MLHAFLPLLDFAPSDVNKQEDVSSSLGLELPSMVVIGWLLSSDGTSVPQ